jgi:hypothetical protein
MDTRPGPVRDLAVQLTDEWLGQLELAVRDAQAEGALEAAEDPEQLAFELDAYMLMANALFVLRGDPKQLDRARRALERRLEAAATVSG